MMADERVSVPKGPREPRDHLAKPENVDLARILKALQTIEEHTQARDKSPRVFLAFLPLIWGAISLVLWFIYFLVSSRS